MIRLSAEWVLPIAAPPIRAGAVLVDAGGRIAHVGADGDVPRPAGVREIRLGAAALLPGLVNTHAHPELTGYRGLLEDLAFPDWIAMVKRVRAAEDPGLASLAARWTCIESIAAGITTIGATEKSGAALHALREAGLRGVVYHEVFGADPAQAEPALEELRMRVERARGFETDLVRAGVSPHAPYTVSDALFAATARYALAEDLPVAIHTAESADETAYVSAGTGRFADRHRAGGLPITPRGRSTIDVLERTGVLRTRPLLIHCVHIDARDADRIAAAGATVAHCPTANARLAHGAAPIELLLERDVAMGLGSDSVASNNRIDVLEEARLAQLLLRARSRDPSALPAGRALELATLGGARALGLGEVVGSLEPGRDADLCAVALDGPHVLPVHDPAAAVVLAARASDVILTMVRGRILHGAGTDVRRAAASLRAELEASAANLHAAVDP